MKRKTIFSFVLIALLLIGIGYAAISDHLEVGGTVNTDCAELNLIFTDAQWVAGSNVDVDLEADYKEKEHKALGGVASAPLTQNSDKAGQAYANVSRDRVELTVNNMAHKGDIVVFVLTIANVSAASDMKAYFESLPAVSYGADQKDLFTVTARLSQDYVLVGLENAITLTVTVVLNESVSLPNVTGTFAIDLTGTYRMASRDVRS